MKITRVDVEHFGCIRRADVELGPGLNVLYGPNDLGKSTLARAVRAALLIQHSSSAADDYLEWDSDEKPLVKVTLELANGQLWRVEKRFATNGGASILYESRDGQVFSPYKKGREVDEEIRSRLGWGIASPASRGAPRGLPSSFLATVLLGEQTDVAGVLRQTLEADTDESGRERLTAALAAFAQDPLFKSILEAAQTKVDEAFTATGRRKGGKASPFKAATEEVKRINEHLQGLRARVADAENAQRSLEAKRENQERRKDALDNAIVDRDRLNRIAQELEARRKVEAELAPFRQRLSEEQMQLQGLQARVQELEQAEGELATARAFEVARAKERDDCVQRRTAADEAVRRAKSAEAEQARQIRRAELDKRRLELEAQIKERVAEQKSAREARTLAREIEEAERAADQLKADQQAQNERSDRAAKDLDEASRRLELLDVAVRLEQERALREGLEHLEQVRAEIEADRAKAAEHRERARELEGALVHGLPSAEEVDALRRIAQEREVAEARLGGGLAVVVERLRAVALEARADGSPVELSGEGSVSFDAERGFELRVGDVATVSVTAGERSARLAAEGLRERYRSEVEPVLARVGVPSLDALAERARDGVEAERKIASVLADATSLEERASGRAEQLGAVADKQAELAAIGRELEGKPREEAQALMTELGSRDLDAHRAKLRDARARAQSDNEDARSRAAQLDTEGQVLASKIEAKRGERAKLDVSTPDEGWDALEAGLEAAIREGTSERDAVDAELAALVSEQSQQVDQAEAAQRDARAAVEQAEMALEEAKRGVVGVDERVNRLRGEIEARKEAVARFDIESTQRELDAIWQRLQALPKPERELQPDELEAAYRAVQYFDHEHEQAKDEVRKAEGALQMVGGQVVREELAASEEALRLAEQKEGEVEVEYDAWRLLVDTLREAENTEGQHLGLALSQPISERFARLTQERYGALAVGPNLRAEGLHVAGVLRDVERLSVGTQEQLATLLRLTVAEHLGSTLVLDDHLTQTDLARSAWFRDVLREHANKAQVIVLTCRPLDYLLKEDLPDAGQPMASRAAGLVRAIDMSQVIVRGESAAPRVARLGAE